jgi:hypothetical protein
MQCALWGYNKGETDVECPYKCNNVDALHQWDLGIFKISVDVFCMNDNIHNWNLQKIDTCLSYIRRTSCDQSFWIPSIERGGYFSSNVNFVAFEHWTKCYYAISVINMSSLFKCNMNWHFLIHMTSFFWHESQLQ